MNLSQLIVFVYPAARPMLNFSADDEEITHWNEAVLGPQPTLADIETHRAAAEAAVESKRQTEATENANRGAMEGQLGASLTQLRAFQNATSPTTAQTVVVVKLLCRVMVMLVLFQLKKFDVTN